MLIDTLENHPVLTILLLVILLIPISLRLAGLSGAQIVDLLKTIAEDIRQAISDARSQK